MYDLNGNVIEIEKNGDNQTEFNMITDCEKQTQKIKNTHLSGFARTRCPSVTKLLSCRDINHAKDETLHKEITLEKIDSTQWHLPVSDHFKWNSSSKNV